MPVVGVSDFAPDQAPYMGTALQVARNTIPREDGSDGPLQAPGVMTSALPAACRGAVLAADGSTGAELVAGTATGLYRLDGTSWDDLSGATYAVPTNREWRFAQFGTRLIATNYADAPQTYTIGSGVNFAGLSADAPRGRYVATVEPGFLMFGDVVGRGASSAVGTLPNGVWWSSINDATQWPASGTAAAVSAQSDYQQLPLGDAVQGILPAIGGANAAVFTERSIYRVEYQGGTIVFAFREADRSRGCYAPGSLVAVGPVAYFLSEEGFMAFDGQQSTPIGYGRVDRFFWGDVDASRMDAVKAVVNPIRRIIIWSYLTRAGSPRWLIYSYANNRWRLGDDASLAIQTWVQRVAPTVDDTLVSLATTTFGFGGKLLSGLGGFILSEGGARILIGTTGPATFAAAFNSSNQLVGYAGNALEAVIETGESDAQGRRVFVSGLRPLTDAGTVLASIGARDAFNSTVQYTTETAPTVTGVCPQRISTRYARARLRIPAGTPWTYLQGADVQARPEGRR